MFLNGLFKSCYYCIRNYKFFENEDYHNNQLIFYNPPNSYLLSKKKCNADSADVAEKLLVRQKQYFSLIIQLLVRQKQYFSLIIQSLVRQKQYFSLIIQELVNKRYTYFYYIIMIRRLTFVRFIRFVCSEMQKPNNILFIICVCFCNYSAPYKKIILDLVV